MALEVVYRRRKDDLGRPCLFSDIGAQVLVSIPSSHEARPDLLYAKSTATDLDTAPPMSVHSVNTITQRRVAGGMLHIEGGWSDTIDTSDTNQIARFRERVSRTPAVRAEIAAAASIARMCVKQNNIIDLYEEYFETDEESFEPLVPALYTQAVLRDPSPTSRAAMKVAWHPLESRLLAVAYCNPDINLAHVVQVQSHVWNLDRPDVPSADLLPHSQLSCLAYNPQDSGLLVAGCFDGTVTLFDVRKGACPVSSSELEVSHHLTVTDAVWFRTASGMDLATISFDAQVCWWDARKLAEPVERQPLAAPVSFDRFTQTRSAAALRAAKDPSRPSHVLPTQAFRSPRARVSKHRSSGVLTSSSSNPEFLPNPASRVSIGGTCLTLTPGPGGQRLLAGCDFGVIASCTRSASMSAASAGWQSHEAYLGHAGIVNAVCTHPMLPKYFLSAGDNRSMVWSVTSPNPILVPGGARADVCAATWSPTRAGVWFAARMDGVLEAWDLLQRRYDCVLEYQAGNAPIYSLGVQAQGRLLAAADAAGSVTVCSMTDSLRAGSDTEPTQVAAILDQVGALGRLTSMADRRPPLPDARIRAQELLSVDSQEQLKADMERAFFAHLASQEQEQQEQQQQHLSSDEL